MSLFWGKLLKEVRGGDDRVPWPVVDARGEDDRERPLVDVGLFIAVNVSARSPILSPSQASCGAVTLVGPSVGRSGDVGNSALMVPAAAAKVPAAAATAASAALPAAIWGGLCLL